MKKINTLVVLSILVLTSVVFNACGPSKGSLAAAREAFKKKEYFTAGENYKAVYSKKGITKEEKNEACYQTGECYRLQNDMKNAENWYRKSVKGDPTNAEAQFRLGQSLKANQKYSEAIVEFNAYKKASPENAEKADKEIKGCELALKWKNEKTRYVVENVKTLNTKWSDFSPMFYKRNELFFTSDREKGASNKMFQWTGNGYTDIYRVEYKADKKNANNIKYNVPVLVDKDMVNTPYNDGAVCFDARGTTMYYTQCNGKDGKGKNCRIFMATAAGTQWSEPTPLSFSTDSFTCGHPCLSKDGEVMFFSSDMPGGFGGKDLWYVTYTKRSKTWGDPINLGPTINTEGDEMYPFVADDGTLYFSSSGHVGLGGVDIYYSKGENTDWSEPINMKSPVNSGGDDFSLTMSKDKESGYFSSNREGGRGQDDIYRFYMTPLVFTLSGVVRDSVTRELLPNTTITIINSTDTGKLIIRTDATGSYKITLKTRTDYELFAAKEDYYDSKVETQTTRGLEQSTDLIQDFVILEFDFTTVFTLEGIYYDLDKANIRKDAALILDTMVQLLNKYPRIRIELGSHTDCRADSAYNQGLSQRRADSAVAYISGRGIDSARMVAKGYGEAMLVNDCACEGNYVKRACTEEEHQLNRRTTFRLLDNKYIPKNKQEMKTLTPEKTTPKKAPTGRPVPQRR
jgi:peptidoglycan-associated lipoprotein